MISEKNILYTDFEGGKLARVYLGKIISCPEKIVHRYMSAKQFPTPEVWENIIAHNKSPIPSSPTKVKWATL